jgi:hypothetical protein
MLGGILTGGRRHVAMVRSMDTALPESRQHSRIGWPCWRNRSGRLRPRHIGMLRALARSNDEFAKLA